MNADRQFARIYADAEQAGLRAARAATPATMVVSDPRSGQQWVVPDGVCGFAWVTVRPGTCAFARWLRKHQLAQRAYEGGMQIWIGAHGQSYDRKHAHAAAMARSLSEQLPEIQFYPGGRLD